MDNSAQESVFRVDGTARLPFLSPASSLYVHPPPPHASRKEPANNAKNRQSVEHERRQRARKCSVEIVPPHDRTVAADSIVEIKNLDHSMGDERKEQTENGRQEKIEYMFHAAPFSKECKMYLALYTALKASSSGVADVGVWPSC